MVTTILEAGSAHSKHRSCQQQEQGDPHSFGIPQYITEYASSLKGYYNECSLNSGSQAIMQGSWLKAAQASSGVPEPPLWDLVLCILGFSR